MSHPRPSLLAALATAALLAVLPAACGNGGGQSSSGNLDDFLKCQVGDDGRDTCICYDEAHLSVDTFLIKTPLDTAPTGHPNHRQHIKVGACEAYIFYWIDQAGMFYWIDLVTNCAEDTLGGMSSASGLPASCLREALGGGGEDGSPQIYYQMGCVCCVGDVCGRSCHDIPHLTCAPYSYDFPVPTPSDDPRNHPDECDCSNTP